MEAIMNTDQYKQRLLAMEEELSSRMKRAGAAAREPIDDSTSDAADESTNNEQKEERLWKLNTDRTMLSQVQNALERIESGTFGKCLADGEPIDEKRLEAMPWTPYCLEHQQELEKSQPRRTANL
jgi:DnaK suppressor protein